MIKDFSDIAKLNSEFSNFIMGRAFQHETTFFDDSKYECFDDKLTTEEALKEAKRESDSCIAVYKRGFLDAILLFSK